MVLLQVVVNNLLTELESICSPLGSSSSNLTGPCVVSSPPEWPVLMQVPGPEFRAIRTDFIPFNDLPDGSCKKIGSCPATILLTGGNQTLGQSIAENFFTSWFPLNSSDILNNLGFLLMGTDTSTGSSNFFEPAFLSDDPMYIIQPWCLSDSTFYLPIQLTSARTQEVRCVQGSHLWRNSSSEVNDELFKGYQLGNREGKVNEIVAAYDLLNTNTNNFNVSVWYNSTYKDNYGSRSNLMRAARSLTLVHTLNLFLAFRFAYLLILFASSSTSLDLVTLYFVCVGDSD
ncbi:hypothetical protein GIB67_007146 [Kingdonia uniflora]|uniref:Uncharacterized protein n=1 Tax=Kingdonia uniflora TaxID=39325 RepID=A0A7J7MLD0_9MAGN|nr:hypothetical protein GIB67_007146 [Kingdonia uniflora]